MQTKQEQIASQPSFKFTEINPQQLLTNRALFRQRDDGNNRMKHSMLQTEEIKDDNRLLCALDKQVLR